MLNKDHLRSGFYTYFSQKLAIPMPSSERVPFIGLRHAHTSFYAGMPCRLRRRRSLLLHMHAFPTDVYTRRKEEERHALPHTLLLLPSRDYTGGRENGKRRLKRHFPLTFVFFFLFSHSLIWEMGIGGGKQKDVAREQLWQ